MDNLFWSQMTSTPITTEKEINSYKIVFRFSSTRIFRGSAKKLADFVATKRRELQGGCCTSVNIACSATGIDEYEIIYSFIATHTFVGAKENMFRFSENKTMEFQRCHFDGVGCVFQKQPPGGQLIFGTNQL